MQQLQVYSLTPLQDLTCGLCTGATLWLLQTPTHLRPEWAGTPSLEMGALVGSARKDWVVLTMGNGGFRL
jgi:hypothetical protein